MITENYQGKFGFGSGAWQTQRVQHLRRVYANLPSGGKRKVSVGHILPLLEIRGQTGPIPNQFRRHWH